MNPGDRRLIEEYPVGNPLVGNELPAKSQLFSQEGKSLPPVESFEDFYVISRVEDHAFHRIFFIGLSCR